MEDTTIEDILKTFENFYVQKDYENALLTLQKHEKNLPDDFFNFNLGTVYLKMENWPLARFHLLKASESGFRGQGLSQNLFMAESKLHINQIEKPLNATDFLIKGAFIISGELLTTFSLVILFAGMLILKKKASLARVLILGTLVMLPIGVNFWIKSWPKSIVIESQPIFDGPSGIFRSVGELSSGTLILTWKNGDWYKVIYPSRFQGWITKKGLKELN